MGTWIALGSLGDLENSLDVCWKGNIHKLGLKNRLPYPWMTSWAGLTGLTSSRSTVSKIVVTITQHGKGLQWCIVLHYSHT